MAAQRKQISAEAWRFLRAYDFPGNVRELANIIERAVIVSANAEILAADLPESMRVAAARRARKAQRPSLAEVESEYIRETLAATKGNKTEAARSLASAGRIYTSGWRGKARMKAEG